MSEPLTPSELAALREEAFGGGDPANYSGETVRRLIATIDDLFGGPAVLVEECIAAHAAWKKAGSAFKSMLDHPPGDSDDERDLGKEWAYAGLRWNEANAQLQSYILAKAAKRA